MKGKSREVKKKMSFLPSMDISASGITAQKNRMDVIAQNIANKDTTRTENAQAYRRKLVVFREIGSSGFFSNLKYAKQKINPNTATKGGVLVDKIIEDQSDFIPVYDPMHPDANDEGYVMMPNVNTSAEMVDAMATQRSYNANITAFNTIKEMARKALEIGR